MKIKMSYESGALIHRALEDIDDLGDSFMIIAIYDGEFITDYITVICQLMKRWMDRQMRSLTKK